MQNDVEKIHELVERLNRYRNEYYNENNPSIDDPVYDRLYDELKNLEKRRLNLKTLRESQEDAEFLQNPTLFTNNSSGILLRTCYTDFVRHL